MKKQKISFFFLILTYIIMMGHILIPHHHHHHEGDPVSLHHHHDDHTNDHDHDDHPEEHNHLFSHAEHVEHTVIQSSINLISFLLIKSSLPVAVLLNDDKTLVSFSSFVNEFYPPPDFISYQFYLTPSLAFRGPPSFFS